MSPFGWKRASFHTMLTVLNRWLTASLGKSLCGNRRLPGMNAASIDVTFTLLRRAGRAQAATGVMLRQGRGVLVMKSLVLVPLLKQLEKKRFVNQLYS